MDIKDKVAIVTGAVGGIGFTTVKELLRNGAKFVAMLDVSDMKNQASTCLENIELEFGKGRSAYFICDVTKRKEFEDVYDSIIKSQGTVHILINNAGIFREDQPDLMMDVNFKAVVNCALATIERMGKHNGGKGGTIINTASVTGLIAAAAIPIYTATKSGICGFTKALKKSYESTGVRMAAICPGVTQTNLVEGNLKQKCLPFMTQEFIIENMKLISKKRQTPEHVALSIIKMVQVAEPGALWVTEDNELPYVVEEIPLNKDKRIQI